MKLHAFIDVETKNQTEKILNNIDLKPFISLGKLLWEIKSGEFELNIPGGKIIYKPDEYNPTNKE